MSLAAFKKELVEYKEQQAQGSADFLKKDFKGHKLVLEWRNTSDKTPDYYNALFKKLEELPENEYYGVVRYLSRYDLAFLFCYTLNRKDGLHPWLIERAHELQDNPNGYLDLWAREHYKSTLITFALSIQDILTSHGYNPDAKWQGREVTIGVFSCTRPIAKAFLAQIKREFESNTLLQTAFSDILWDNPSKYSPKWSEDAGLVIKRKTNPKEATIEAWGIVEGQPTSKHFFICVYDDLVTEDHIRSPYMIKKVIDSWGISINLGTEGGFSRYIGTRYHLNDPYSEMLKRKAVTIRKYGPTKDGSLTNNPVLKSQKELERKLIAMGPYQYACQMMQDPTKDESAGFKLEWLRYATVSDSGKMNRYITVDPANEKKEGSDFTAITVWGLGADQNYYVLDRVRDRLDLGERAEAIFRLHKKYLPRKVGYERYGMQSDLFYIKEQMGARNYHFDLYEFGGNLSKLDRIRRLIPLYKTGRIFQPKELIYTDYQGQTNDLTSVFINDEFYCFPVSFHDDMLDCDARILDKAKNQLGILVDFAEFPKEAEESDDVSSFINKLEDIYG